jgi:hypothetical protein
MQSISLKSKLKTLTYWTLPPGIQDILLLFYSKYFVNNDLRLERFIIRDLSRRNCRFKDIHLGERCFILATGPSIQYQDLRSLKGEFCIAVSHFFLHKDIAMISPQYHVLAPYHYPFNFENLKKIFEGFQESYKNELIYFFGYTPYEYSIYRFLDKNPQYKNSNQYFIDYLYSSTLNEKNYLSSRVWQINKKPFAIRTVLYSAIQVALYMGFKEIYLVGCDHDYLNDTSRVTNHHFYKEEEGISDAEHLNSFTTERWFEEYYFRWKEYRLMKQYAEYQGCSIFNATEGGMLDVFPRVRLSDVI